jgi:hypothetical protein
MGNFKRIVGSVIVNGCLTALLWGTAYYILHVLNNGQEASSSGAQIAIALLAMYGIFTGSIIGFIIGLVNESAVKSFLIAAFVCSVFGLRFIISDSTLYSPSMEVALIQIMLFVLAIVLAALSAGGTAKLFNRPLKEEQPLT